MTTTTTEQTFEDELADAKSWAKVELLAAFDKASERLKEMTELGSAVGIREAAEAIVAVERALRSVGA